MDESSISHPFIRRDREHHHILHEHLVGVFGDRSEVEQAPLFAWVSDELHELSTILKEPGSSDDIAELHIRMRQIRERLAHEAAHSRTVRSAP